MKTLKTLVNKNNPAIKIIADTLLSDSFNYITGFCSVPKSDWTLVEEEPKHTEVWVEGRTIFEQDANTFVNTEEEPEAKLTGWVARDREYNPYFGLGLVLFTGKPKRTGNCWSGEIASQLPWKFFPDLKWEDEPVEVEITIRRK